MENIAIGVDIGGSHISCAGFDLDTGRYLPQTFSESDLDNHAESPKIIKSWGSAIKETLNKIKTERISGIGFAMPGPFDYVNGISLFTGENGKYEKTYGLNVPRELKKYFNLPYGFPIRFINDATAFALGEDWIGSAKDYCRSLAITLGTGFGSAFIRDTLPVVGGDQVPEQGCVWHLPFADGIADDYFSTRGLINRYFELSGKQTSGVKEIAEAAPYDSQAQAIFDDFGSQLIRFLSPWIEKFEVEILVIGGNISRAIHLFGPAMKREIEKGGISMSMEVSKLKETAAIIGSSRLLIPDFYEEVKPILAKM